MTPGRLEAGPDRDDDGYRWMTLEERWKQVFLSEKTLSSRSGGWKVALEYSGDGLAPIAGEPDEVAIYRRHNEVARWTLEEIDAKNGVMERLYQ